MGTGECGRGISCCHLLLCLLDSSFHFPGKFQFCVFKKQVSYEWWQQGINMSVPLDQAGTCRKGLPPGASKENGYVVLTYWSTCSDEGDLQPSLRAETYKHQTDITENKTRAVDAEQAQICAFFKGNSFSPQTLCPAPNFLTHTALVPTPSQVPKGLHHFLPRCVEESRAVESNGPIPGPLPLPSSTCATRNEHVRA